MKLGIMSAMQEEIGLLLNSLEDPIAATSGSRTFYRGKLLDHEAVLVMSRWGKVAAATTVTQLILQHEVDAVLFTGVAGAISDQLAIGDIVIADSLIQHDMDASPFFERFEIPLLGKKEFYTDSSLSNLLQASALSFLQNGAPASDLIKTCPKVVRGLVASGDRFFASSQAVLDLKTLLADVLCVEMEGAAVAQVCHEYAIPFCLVRTISDGANHDASIDFPRFIQEVASRYSLGIVSRFLSGLKIPCPA